MTLKFEKPGKKEKVSKTPQKAKISVLLTKSQRLKVFNKFDGCCAYCSEEIDFSNFHVEHVIPKRSFKNPKDADFWDNFRPSCSPCNLRKGPLSVERFKSELVRDIYQLKRDSAKFRLLIKYGLISINDFPVSFYFERYKKGERK